MRGAPRLPPRLSATTRRRARTPAGAALTGNWWFFRDYITLSGSGIKSLMVWQLVTYMFLHDPGGFGHIVFNMLALWMIGSDLERDWGTKLFLKFYFLCGVGAGVCVVLANALVGNLDARTIGRAAAAAVKGAKPLAHNGYEVPLLRGLVEERLEAIAASQPDSALRAYEAAAKDNARLYNELQQEEKIRGELLHRVISAQEDERKRIARELEAKAYLHGGLSVEFHDEQSGTRTTYHYEDGLRAFLQKIGVGFGMQDMTANASSEAKTAALERQQLARAGIG